MAGSKNAGMNIETMNCDFEQAPLIESMGEAMTRIKRDSGFTILELTLAVVILSIGAAVSAFSLNQLLPDLRLKAAVRDLKSDLNMAKLVAVRNNTFVTALFDTVNDTYTIFRDDGGGVIGNAGNFVQDAGEPTIKIVNIANRYSSVNMYWATFSAGTPRLYFDGRGIVDGVGGSVRMRNSKNNFRRVTVSILGKSQIEVSDDGGVNWVAVD